MGGTIVTMGVDDGFKGDCDKDDGIRDDDDEE